MTNLLAAAKQIEKRLLAKKWGTKVHIFDSEQAYQEARLSGKIRDGDVSIVDDIPDIELEEMAHCLKTGQPLPDKLLTKMKSDKSIFSRNNPARRKLNACSEEELEELIEKYESINKEEGNK